MTPQEHEDVKRIFLAACLLHESDRSAFLDQACAAMPQLREEVESLLKYHDPATLIKQGGGADQRAAVQVDSDEREATPTAQTSSPLPMLSGLSDQLEQERFSPGAVIADRYRIERLLGRGGMGEVYKAQDMTLGTTVALKFVLAQRAGDPLWLERLRQEVRLARQVTHANVCRVFDIGQAGQDAFISMEYVDGEDLGALLRRVGRLSGEKTIEIAQQICEGLGAAHDKGILHRDLKPGNIMIDGQGRVRITDFGIAAAVPRQGQQTSIAGSPSYIAPEVLRGGAPSLWSDIYSLGLVLYECVTGRQAFMAASFADRREDRSLPLSPCATAKEVDPALERIILECMEEQPELRPSSVYAVAGALPGRDPLAAVLAEGHTPAPGLLVETRGRATRPAVTWGVALWALAGLLLAMGLAGQTLLLTEAGRAKAPPVLEDRAQEMLATLSGAAQGRGIPRGFRVYHGTAGMKPGLFYEYWQGDVRQSEPGPLTVPEPFDLTLPGNSARLVRLDPVGNLCLYMALPERAGITSGQSEGADWATVFRMAGLDINEFGRQAQPARSPVLADQEVTWVSENTRPGDASERVEGASLEGRIVYFRVGQTPLTSRSPARDASAVSRMALFLAMLAGALVLARRNMTIGRGDRNGAWRLALVVFGVQVLLWGIRRLQATQAPAGLSELIGGLRFATFAAAAAWVFYMALEPQVRRFWPHAIVSFTKLLAGRFKDPSVGWNILVGCAIGASLILLQQAGLLAARAMGWQAGPLLPMEDNLGPVTGVRYMVDITAYAVHQAIWGGMGLLLLMLVLRMGLGRAWLAAVGFVAAATICLAIIYPQMGGSWLMTGVAAAGLAAALTRAGLLAGMVSLFWNAVLRAGVPTLNRHAWCADVTGYTIVLLLGLAAAGLYAVRRGAAGLPANRRVLQ